jgi:cell division protein FtsW (lipid II flippase)
VEASIVPTAASSAASQPIAAIRARIAWPSIIETAVAVAAVVAIVPWFARFGVDGSVRDGRFADTAVTVQTLPSPMLSTLCATYGRLAEPMVRERLCTRVDASSRATAGEELLPAVLGDGWRRIAAAFQTTMQRAESRLSELPQQERDGARELPLAAVAIQSLEAEVRAFVQRYALERTGTSGPRPLACAFDRVAAALSVPIRPGDERGTIAAANAVLLVGGAMDGHSATAAVASSALLPTASPARQDVCASLSLPDALARGATLMADARASALMRAKNEAMRDLLITAGWQWSAWMLAGLALLKLSRTRLPAAVGISIALAAWAGAAWAGRVPWPLAPDRTLNVGRVDASWDAMPAEFVIVLLAAAAVLLALAPLLHKPLARVPQTLASRVGYAGFVVATGIGWLLLLDLSANGQPGNRYLALYHHGHLWLAMLVLTVLAFLRPALGRALAWLLSVIDELGGRAGRLLGPLFAPFAVVLLVLLIVGVMGALLAGIRQLTSELGRVWLIVGVAWFYFLRGAPVGERLAKSGGFLASLVRYAWPLGFVGLVLVGIMLVTRDMGPLLIASYAAGAFLAASVAMWWHVRSGASRAPATLAACLFAAWIVAITLAVFEFGAVDPVTADRLENLAAPLASANDQLALVTWFRQAAPAGGFGLGSVPWCGFAGSSACAGVPAQIQSDYTFTALVGAFGGAVAWALTLACALWMHRLIRYHGHVTSGEPRFVRHAGRVVADPQAFLSWIGVTWVVLTLCQLAVTVAGNLAILPLTGVTFPFVSFGMTSLVVNSAFLALCVNVSLPEAADA